MRHQRRWLSGFCLSVLVCFARSAWADADHCDVCGSAFAYVSTYYTGTDKVTHKKVFLCYACASCTNECYICSLPVKTNYIALADGRFLCARDGKTAILEESKAREICDEVVENLNRMFWRFLTFPSTNVDVALVDRVNLYDQFAVVGNDFECPEVLGYIKSQTNHGAFKHAISLMSALPRAEFQATCAHEYSHAWVFENVPLKRRKTLSRDAHEGFCELVAFLLMDSLHEEEQKKIMLRNTYTRGQIDLFIEAEKRFGFNDVLDWMRWGVNPELNAASLDDVRNVEMPRPKAGPATKITFYVEQPTAVPDTLLLKGISSSESQPLALINDHTFAAGESAKVRVGTTNMLVRCLAVGGHSARIRIVDSGREMELQLKASK
jgi:hypothetical protein